ncbi:MAG: asparagine synthase-related protein [Planctomycetota bacterium]
MVLLDGRNGRVEMFRNLVGSTFTYYCETPEGFVFGSNLADVARRSGMPLRPDPEMLPVYFIYRFVPGGNTLFAGIKRLQPGERVSYQDGRLLVKQVKTFADLDEPHKTNERESIERVEATMAEVVGNLMSIAPKAAGLLSGGVDSTYIQAHWNKLWRMRNGREKPRSTAIWLDHPATTPDQEYALSAVRELDTNHLAVRLTGLDVQQMSETLSAVGEMPNHVQSFYFGPLAKAMAENGIAAGLCGEGADGLFGNSEGDALLSARKLYNRFPTSALRVLGSLASQCMGHAYAAYCFRLSNRLNNATDFVHPVNSTAAFTDWDLVSACFGSHSAVEAFRYRREILSRYRVPEDGMHLQEALAIGYLGEAVNTASYWNQVAANSDVEFIYPFMDSRILRVATNMDLNARFVPGNPKQVLKKVLARHVPDAFVNRPKRGFGQPIFQWIAEGGPLRGAINRIGDYEFLDKKTIQRAKAKPNWFLYNLLIYDLWHKAFIG